MAVVECEENHSSLQAPDRFLQSGSRSYEDEGFDDAGYSADGKGFLGADPRGEGPCQEAPERGHSANAMA